RRSAARRCSTVHTIIRPTNRPQDQRITSDSADSIPFRMGSEREEWSSGGNRGTKFSGGGRQTRRLFPFVERIIGDAGYQGPKMAAAVARTGTWNMEIARRCDRHRFVVLPKRWIVERTIAWISHNRRLARDFERHCRIATAFVRTAMIRHLTAGLSS
ncbi:transposase, partial [Roseomonas sp. CAU 1739]|uniref:transposase n=1 Tax=Roseomonas sp. CAU 1739 TaxID=3140364 RepID=UPI00325BE099